jgi:fructose-1-phosphate kinase PfkB-like protein
MENHVDTIRNAIAKDASTEARAAGIAACRNILAELEPATAQALAPSPSPVISPDVIPQLVAMVKQMDVNQLLDVAIERLRALNAARPGAVQPAQPELPRALTFPLVPIPAVLKKAK